MECLLNVIPLAELFAGSLDFEVIKLPIYTQQAKEHKQTTQASLGMGN
jgi:hypothetical protein